MSVDAELIRLFYELWESAQAGCDYLDTTATLPDSLERVPRSHEGEVSRALRNLNRIGHLTNKGPLPGEFVASLIGKDAIKAIDKAMPLIEEARTRLEDPEYLQYVDRLLEVCRGVYPHYEPKYHHEEPIGFGLAR
jgi:hypothetical protein